ncbi:universal stress protein [Nocardioides daeguensis]|uniref:Universal stress protein n=1 Tax=Nocardioides daeguensis TaxID=908359 RepID=A0ABP6UQB7_9ACTN|nr:universal stress protein [Nocardioides daeguensis]MBV6728357.1 universal stress protein [Nocardioides daeguensis]MCR1773166.1 universal stress protein [Nocardioides daeguensis]
MEVDSRAPIVVATDGTDRSAGALRYGVHEARRRGVALKLVHVAPTATMTDPMFGYAPELAQDLQAHGRTVLADATKAVRDIDPGLPVESVLAVGMPVGQIVDAAASAQLVVLGRETRRGLERLLTGATTAAVAGHAAVPTVVVPGDWQLVEHGRMVVGIESEECARPLLSRAFERAAQRGAQLVVVHAWDLPVPNGSLPDPDRYVQEWRAAGAHLLSTVLGEWRRAYPGVAVETSVVHGQAAHALVVGAEASDLLLVGRRARGPLHWAHLGATARAVLRGSRVPVEVVPLAEESHG